jgi:uncharacterized caspase-like protein
MSAPLPSTFKARLLGAAIACLAAVGALTNSVPAFAQAGTPPVSLVRTAEAANQATAPGAPVANVGNPAAITGAERRIALVIGNSAYENVTALPNPANDAREIGKFLNSAGFEVIQATDLDHDEMIQVLQDFSAKVAERGPNTAAFIYYAGHGLQIDGDNYLVPVDAKITSEADVPTEAVRLVDVMATLQAVPSRIRMVVLDACRNNPFTSLKDTGRGLSIVDAPNGSIVAYSTAPGTEAFDGEGKNSPYTTAFLRLGREPNVPIEQFFKKVRVVVNDTTDGKQTPWESSSLTSDFYFFGDTAVAAAKSVDPVQQAQANASANRPVQVAQVMRTRSPRDAYNMAIAEGSTEYYQEFVRVYPYDPYADHIRRLLAARMVSVAWHAAVLANSKVAYQNFYSQYYDSPYGNLALKLSAQPKMVALYQPTKIMVAPQIAPQVRLTNFNGVNVGQGNNAPIGLGGNGSLFNKRFGNGGFGGNGGNGGLGNGGGMGQKIGLPGNGAPGNTGIGGGIGQKIGGLPGNGGIGNTGIAGGLGQKVGLPNGNNGGQVLSPNGRPGIDLAKGNRIGTRIGDGRLTTLPNGQNGAPVGNGAGPLMGKGGKVMPGNTGINGGRIGNVGTVGSTGNVGNTGINPKVGLPGRINQTGTVNPAGNGRPLMKRFDQPRMSTMQSRPQMTQRPMMRPAFQSGPKMFGNGGGGGGMLRSKPAFGGSRPMFGGGGGGGMRFAGGGGGFRRSFR